MKRQQVHTKGLYLEIYVLDLAKKNNIRKLLKIINLK